MNTKHRSCNPVLSNSLDANKLYRRREEGKFTLVKKGKEKKIHLKKDWFLSLPKQLPGFCPEALWTGKVCLRFCRKFPPFYLSFALFLIWETGNNPKEDQWEIWEQLIMCACDTWINFSVVVFQDGGQEEAEKRKESPCFWWKFTKVFSFSFIFSTINLFSFLHVCFQEKRCA